jgi:NAD+ synthase (glutamine-hydrolysing)
LLVVPNASPYERGKDDVRLDLVVRRAREAGSALAYANMVGGQDELVFDGDSILVTADGTLVARGPQFEEALVVADLDLPPAPAGEMPGDQPVDAEDGTVITIKRVSLPLSNAAPGERPEPAEGPLWPRLPDPAEVYAALVTGVRDYVNKNGFRSAILALSGGIDSALTATIAVDAIGADNVYRALGQRRRGPGQAAGRARGDDPDRLDGRRVHRGADPGRVPRDRAARGEPAGPGARRGPDGTVQRGRPPGPDHRQQKRARGRLLDPVRRLGGRVRAD